MNVIVTKDDNIKDNNTKYIIITNDILDISKFNNYSVKPTLIMFDGTYVIDLDKNNVIIDNCIDKKEVSKIKKYALSHEVKLTCNEYNNKIYELKLNTNNFHRRLIIPYMFKDKYKNIDIKVENKDIYVTKKYNSLLNAIDLVFEYLHINYNFMDLQSICDYVDTVGFYKKGYDLCEN